MGIDLRWEEGVGGRRWMGGGPGLGRDDGRGGKCLLLGGLGILVLKGRKIRKIKIKIRRNNENLGLRIARS